ncbi:schlafen family member 13-like isoform X1 [Acipenser ruthenus]|uniref:schlafen family member 13-like isoform X1 n=2 Tax=Acipenser ruthenus TaxID=7906 RepID=UPI0027405217|nr:schlafen family member 13-like isoform X1 [Acipenser ruthenus]
MALYTLRMVSKNNFAPVWVETDYPDQVIDVGEVTLGEDCRNKMSDASKRKAEKNTLVQVACALLNSGGGIIVAKSKNKDYNYTTDGIGLDLELGFGDLVKPSLIQDHFSFLQQGIGLLIFVKTWCAGLANDESTNARICSAESHLYKRSGTSAIQIAPTEAAELLQKKKKETKKNRDRQEEPPAKRPLLSSSNQNIEMPNPVKLFCSKEYVRLGETLGFGEDMHVEFKSFEKETSVKKRLSDTLPKYISAFANTDGGFLLIGVNDKTKKVVGCGKDENPSDIENEVDKAFRKVIPVHCAHCEKQENCKYSLKIINVLGESDVHCGFILALEINKFCCVVFSENPDSWKMDGKNIKSLEAGEWLEMMTGTDPVIDQLCQGFEKELSMSAAPPQCKPVYGLKGSARLDALQNTLFPVQTDGINGRPETLCTEMFAKYPNLENIMKPEGVRGVLIMSRSWAVDLDQEKNDEVVFDALLISENSPPTLYTVVQESKPDLWKHARLTAFQLKQKLVNLGGYPGMICVIPKVLECHSGALIPREIRHSDFNLDVCYPDSYGSPDIEALLRSLVIVLLSFRSCVSDQLGCEFLNLLTAEQFDILHSKYYFKNFRKVFVHGLPGTGKTVIAAQLMRKIKITLHCKTEEILYICENQPLRRFMEKQDISQCVTRLTFMREDFSMVKHIVVDEAQNFRKDEDDKDWYKKAKKISKNGVFWIFLDYFQTSHTEYNSLPQFEDQNPIVCLTVGVRNGSSIHDFIIQKMRNIVSSWFSEREVRMKDHMEELCNNANCAHTFSGKFKTLKKTQSEIIDFVILTIQTLFSQGHSCKDIAILCCTKEECVKYYSPLLLQLRKKKKVNFAQADDTDKNSIVFDSIRRFSGLERNIVFVMNPVVHKYQQEIGENLLLSAASRARTQLYVLYEKQ